MNLVLDENNYNINNIFFYEPVKNTVMDDSKFIKILYSNEFITLNGIFINFPIKSLLFLAIKSSRFKSKSSIEEFNFVA